MNRADLGKWGEREAERHLVGRRGFKILDKNWRCPLGEIDLVARQKDTLVFVEVKARDSGARLPPKFSLTAAKRRRLVLLAGYYLKLNRLSAARCRFDVVSLKRGEDGKVENLEYLRSAFTL